MVYALALSARIHTHFCYNNNKIESLIIIFNVNIAKYTQKISGYDFSFGFSVYLFIIVCLVALAAPSDDGTCTPLQIIFASIHELHIYIYEWLSV